MRRAMGLGLVGVFFLVGAASAEEARPQIRRAAAPVSQPDPPIEQTRIPLSCKNPGTKQDPRKTPRIVNTSGATLKVGQTIFWNATDGDSGSITLTSDVAAGATVDGSGIAGHSYDCIAHFFSTADLVAKSATWTSADEALVTLGNLDTWVDAPPSVARVETVACQSGQVLATYETSAFSMKKGSTSTLKVPVKRVADAYLRLTVDAKGQVPENDEGNNVFYDRGSTCK
jgi:hypothetical protein